jgi:hypothetical protein
MTKWQEGCLDIHLINSGRGECNFLVLPDGTSFLIDAGELVSSSSKDVPQKPSEDVRPYVTYARYIRNFLPDGKDSIDWCMPSHLHIDHIGAQKAAVSQSPNGYRLAGMMALYDEVPYRNILDMGYPNYNDDETIPNMEGELCEDWQTFVHWAADNKRLKAARFNVGEEQIVLQNNRTAYPNFRIFNIVGNGYAWNKSILGYGALVNANASEGNPASLGIHLNYGNFDFVTCGDLTSAPQNRMAFYYRDYIGKGKLDVFKANHHLASNSWGSQMQNCEFNPRVIVCHTFYSSQPDATLLSSLNTGEFSTHSYVWEKDIFCTNIHPDLKKDESSLIETLKDYNGHIIVRVLPGGAQYYVIMLDDTDFNYRVKSVYGPYDSL